MPDPWQVEAMRAIRDTGRVSIAACHGVGKDALAAWLVLWVMYCFPHPKIPCTAPTSHQLYDLLWSEIAKWRAKMPKVLQDLTDLKSDRFEFVGKEKTWFAVARTARKENSEALQGFHADVILIIADEASGVPDGIFEVLEGAMTGKRAMQLLIGNPTQTSGFFYDSHHSDRSRWYTMRIDHTMSRRVSRDYVASMRRKYGEESNVYRVRVMGLFPKSGDDQTIPLDWIEAAAMREVYQGERAAIVIGVDVARFGSDDSAIVIREGRNVLACQRWNGNDTMQTSGKVIAIGNEWEKRLQGRERLYIAVDSIGVGAGVADKLREYVREKAKAQWSIIEVDAGSKSDDDETHRKRDELWWKTRLWFQFKEPAIAQGIDSEDRQQLIGELASPKYGFTSNGLILVESKEDMKKRGVASPNLADALMQTMVINTLKPEVKKDGWRDQLKPGNSTKWMG